MKIKIWFEKDWFLTIICLIMLGTMIILMIRSFDFTKLIFNGVVLIFAIFTYFRYARKGYSKIMTCERYEVIEENEKTKKI